MNFLYSNPFSFIFLSTLILGIFISLSSSNWFIIWIGLELNLYSFIPLMLISKINQEKEASINYFLTQALASAILLFSSILLPFIFISNYVLSCALFINLGMAPFHFWLPSVINSISWSMCWILSTIQNITPISILIFNSNISLFSSTVAGVGALVGGIGGLIQSQLRAIFAYSSIGHIAWILAASIVSSTLAIFYFISYIIIISSIFAPLNSINTNSINLSGQPQHTPTTQIIIILAILSIGGMPPLFGFFPNIFVILTLTNSNFPFLSLILLVGSVINLFFYTNIFTNMYFSLPTNLLLTTNTNIYINITLSILFIATLSTAIISPLLFPYLL